MQIIMCILNCLLFYYKKFSVTGKTLQYLYIYIKQPVPLASDDYEGALSVYTEMMYLAQERGGISSTGRPLGAFCDILANCEVSRVLLLMLLQVINSDDILIPKHNYKIVVIGREVILSCDKKIVL